MIFISHKTEDKTVAMEVHRRALERDYADQQLFLDSHQQSGIEPGIEWERQIYASLKHSRAMIVLCSPNWLKSQWCFVELGYAKAMSISVFPIIIEPCNLGSTLDSTQSIDLTRAADGPSRDAAFDRLWAAMESRQLGPKDNLPWPPKGETDLCPFPGLMYFDEKHAPVYFGREQERDSVVSRLREMRAAGLPRMLVIVGGSGSGKSSLLRAGVIPWLKHQKERMNWLILPTLRYGETPNDDVSLLARLAESIVASYPSNYQGVPDRKLLRTQFESDNLEQAASDFVEATNELCFAHRTPLEGSVPTLLIPIDQFEEFLSGNSAAPERFLRFLRILLSRSNGRLLVVASMRSDYVDTYEKHAESLKSPFIELFRLPPFPRDRITHVITKPAERVDVVFTDDLVKRLSIDAPNSDALPQLAFTLEKLYRHCGDDKLIELHEYERIGGMSGAISQSVNRILTQEIPANIEKAIRLSFVKHLAQINDSDEFVRKTARWADLPAAAQPLLEQFVRERLLHRSGSNGEQIEVSHEAIFRSWDRLAHWLNESRQVMRWRRDIARSNQLSNETSPILTKAQLAIARSWPKDRPEELNAEEIQLIRKGIFHERLWVGLVIAVILAVSALAAWGRYQTTLAERSREEAKRALTTNLQMFTVPTKLAGQLAAAISRRDAKSSVVKKFDELVSNATPTANTLRIRQATDHLGDTIRMWDATEIKTWDPEQETSSEAVRQAVIELAESIRSAWESQYPRDSPRLDRTREITRKILVEPAYDEALKITQRIAEGSIDHNDLDEFESLYYSELVFLENDEVANEMIEFRETLRGNPKYSEKDLRKIYKQLRLECEKALTEP